MSASISDADDAADMVTVHVGKSGCLRKVEATKKARAAQFRKRDTSYKRKYALLKKNNKLRRDKYIATKAALQHKKLHAPFSCKQKLAKHLEGKDKGYQKVYKKLVANPATAAAKAKLKKDMAALVKQYKAAVKANAGHPATLKRVHAQFDTKFKVLKQASPYYRAVHKLRKGFSWYKKYKK